MFWNACALCILPEEAPQMLARKLEQSATCFLGKTKKRCFLIEKWVFMLD